MKNRLYFIIALYIGLGLTIGCTKGKELVSLNGATYSITGAADGMQMVPVSGAEATGTFSGWYDEQTNGLTFTLGWINIFTGTTKDVITAVNFYGPANPGVNGTLIRTLLFSNANASGSVNLGLAGYAQLSPTAREQLYNGSCYYVICTQNYPSGIVRGQLKAVKN